MVILQYEVKHKKDNKKEIAAIKLQAAQQAATSKARMKALREASSFGSPSQKLLATAPSPAINLASTAAADQLDLQAPGNEYEVEQIDYNGFPDGGDVLEEFDDDDGVDVSNLLLKMHSMNVQ
jgi:hypothetical protein